jgi:hypothetical protein
MKSLNSFQVASLLGVQVLCAHHLLSSSPSTDVGTADTRASAASFAFQGSPARACDSSASAICVASQTSDLVFAGADDGLLEAPSAGSDEAAAQALAPRIIQSSGAIDADVELFRSLLGGPNNGATPGQQPSGRREINWDGVPAALTNVPNFPEDFFNTISPRGLVYPPTGHGLQVSDRSFSDINSAYSGEFIPFSGHKIFSSVLTVSTEVEFLVAGSDTKAAVRGVGVVFLDVDQAGSSGFQLLGEDGVDLGTYFAPIRSDRGGASFVGVVFRKPAIVHVHIRTGNGTLAPNQVDISQGGHNDLVVMDDILYGEPTAIGP